MDIKIPFNKPFLTGKEVEYIRQAVQIGKLSGNGFFTKKCQDYMVERYGFKKALLTTSCTDALEMCALLCGVGENDEVIVPSYTFVSSALAFVRQGCKIVFVDSMQDNPNVDAGMIERAITSRTKVIVVVHYAGVACDMDRIMKIAEENGIFVVEDAAQAIDSYYKGRPLGTIGHLSAFSFHETKNIISGEGGMLGINDDRFLRRAEILWEKGTNRSEFFRGEVNKYGWCDTGSSFLPSEVISAFLWAQLENIGEIQDRRKYLWNRYFQAIKPLSDAGKLSLHRIPDYASNNAHMFYVVCKSLEERTRLICYLRNHGILAVFHYLSLHLSYYYKAQNEVIPYLPNCDAFADRLLRLPLYYGLTDDEQDEVIHRIKEFYDGKI